VAVAPGGRGVEAADGLIGHVDQYTRAAPADWWLSHAAVAPARGVVAGLTADKSTGRTRGDGAPTALRRTVDATPQHGSAPGGTSAIFLGVALPELDPADAMETIAPEYEDRRSAHRDGALRNVIRSVSIPDHGLITPTSK